MYQNLKRSTLLAGKSSFKNVNQGNHLSKMYAYEFITVSFVILNLKEDLNAHQ